MLAPRGLRDCRGAGDLNLARLALEHIASLLLTLSGLSKRPRRDHHSRRGRSHFGLAVPSAAKLASRNAQAPLSLLWLHVPPAASESTVLLAAMPAAGEDPSLCIYGGGRSWPSRPWRPGLRKNANEIRDDARAYRDVSLRLAVAPAWPAKPVGVAQATRRMRARTPLVLVVCIRLRRGA